MLRRRLLGAAGRLGGARRAEAASSMRPNASVGVDVGPFPSFGGVPHVQSLVGVRRKAIRSRAHPGVNPAGFKGAKPGQTNAGRQSANDEKLAQRLGLDSVPVDPEYFKNWFWAQCAWRVCRVPAFIPKKLDTGISRRLECALITQDAMRSGGAWRSKGRAGIEARAAVAADAQERGPEIWEWLANAALEAGGGRVQGMHSLTHVRLCNAVLPHPKRGRMNTTAALARGGKNARRSALYTIRNKAKEEIDLTLEGEELLDHIALNTLLFSEVKVSGWQQTLGMYVCIAGHEAGWETRELHFAASARINAMGEGLQLNPDNRVPITMLSPARLPFTIVPDSHVPAEYDKWLTLWAVPPPQATGSGAGAEEARAEYHTRLADDIGAAIEFCDRTGVKLTVVGLEMQGTHGRSAANLSEVGGQRWTGAGTNQQTGRWDQDQARKELAELPPHVAHWRLQQDELASIVERAVQERARQAAGLHRRMVQEFWLRDWRHEGLSLAEAADKLARGRRDAEWAYEWFKGFSSAYLDEKPPGFAPMRSVVSALQQAGVLRDAEDRKVGKEYVARNVVPLMRATLKHLEGGMSEQQVMRMLAREDDDGWSVAGAKEALVKEVALVTKDTLDARDKLVGGPAGAGGGKSAGKVGKLTPAQAAKAATQRAAEGKPPATAAPTHAAEDHFDPDIFYREFKNFRANFDMLNLRKVAVDDASFCMVMLNDIEQRVLASERDTKLMPLFAMTVEWIQKLLHLYKDKMMEQSRGMWMHGTDVKSMTRDYDEMIARCERLRTTFMDTSRLYEAAVNDLRDALNDLEKEMSESSGAAEALSEAPWRGHLTRVSQMAERLEAFEAGVTEGMRRSWGGNTPPPDHPPGVTCDPQCTLSQPQKRLLTWHIVNPIILQKKGDDEDDEDVEIEEDDEEDEDEVDEDEQENEGDDPQVFTLDKDTLVKHFREAVFLEAGGEGVRVPHEALLPLHDDWLARLEQANAQLVRAYKLRASANSAVDLIAATEKIDPSGIRAAIERAKAAEAPATTVTAAEEFLNDLEEEIRAFIRQRRSGDSLLEPPKQGWTSAGKHIWYDSDAELGRGSLGTAVYHGVYDEKAGSSSVVRRAAAIKRIPLPPGERGASVRALVEREVALHRHLNQSSNRVTFMLGVHLDGADAVFTAMELCGESLSQWLKNAPDGQASNIPVSERVLAASELTAAVADVHAAGVTHNDIKPDNCLRAATGEFKLADLGLGVRMKAADRGSDNQYSMTTFAGYGVNVQMQGRPPEVLQGGQLTSAVDVWSLGCLIYTVLTGARSPYAEDRDTQQLQVGGKGGKVQDAGFQSLYENQRIIRGSFTLQGLEKAKLPRHTATAARHILHDMLQPDPDDRPSASEVSHHPLFWTPERAVEAIRDVYDSRLMGEMSAEEEQKLMAEVWGKGRAKQGERSGITMQGWKDIIVPELLNRMKRRHAREEFKKVTPQSSAEASKVGKEAKGRGRKRGKRGGMAAAVTLTGDGTGYEPTLRDLIRFIRNLHEHPPLERERLSMVRALGLSGTHLLAPGAGQSAATDPWRAARRVVEAYFVQTFPELPLLAHHLLQRAKTSNKR